MSSTCLTEIQRNRHNLERKIMLVSRIPVLVTFGQAMFFFANSMGPENMGYCEKPSDAGESICKSDSYSKDRYVLYDVNPSEGFNLRRDVYVRIAVFVKNCNELYPSYRWHLVLPPWERMYHWRSTDIGEQRQLPWDIFFDVSSLKRYVPVLEMYEFFRELDSSSRGATTIRLDRVYVLHNDMRMFETGKFEDKNESMDCPTERLRYRRIGDDEYSGYFWGYKNLTARRVNCIIFHGTASGLRKNLEPKDFRSFMFDRMEIALHDNYGSREYWRARRSMRYNDRFYEIARKFRSKYLSSEDSLDNTLRVVDWMDEKPRRNASGGPYLAVHLRRRDFLSGRANYVPTIASAAKQLREKMREFDLDVLFVATDAPGSEYEELKNLLTDYAVHRYVPSQSEKRQFKDGGIAIIDQIICSHARYFVGTHESTFTFRIQEDREIMGFPTETTFNRLCGKEKKCSPDGQWKIVW